MKKLQATCNEKIVSFKAFEKGYLFCILLQNINSRCSKIVYQKMGEVVNNVLKKSCLKIALKSQFFTPIIQIEHV